jgi:hypothetical protein
MDGETNINKSIFIKGSRIEGGSTVSNITSEQGTQVTPEMWSTLTRLADTYGKQDEAERARELKALLDQGKHSEAKPIWSKIRPFLQDFANVAQIVNTIDALIR